MSMLAHYIFQGGVSANARSCLHTSSLTDLGTVLGVQVGNANFAFSLQQLVNLPLLWSLEGHLNITNATTPYPQAVPVRLLPTPVR
jgi:hypothetical protein